MKRWRLPLLLALLGILFSACFTFETTEQDAGYSREAISNPWLAAGRVLERNRLQVRYAPAYAGLPAKASVLVLATPLEYLDESEHAALLAWVRRGGHLVTEIDEEADDEAGRARNPVVRELGVHLGEHEFSDDDRRQLAKEKGPRATRLPGEGVLQTRFLASYFLQPGRLAPLWSAEDKHGVHALRYRLGEGRVTVLSDLVWMNNGRIGEGDHAGLLWRVIDTTAGHEVWLVHGSERPSLLALIVEQATPLLVALAICIAAWLWAASRRFGPLQPVTQGGQRRLAEHLEASGRYLLRQGGLKTLFDSSRERLLAHVQRRHPQWRRLPTPELAARLAERARIESAAVLRVLETDEPLHILQFAADLRLINRLRKAL